MLLLFLALCLFLRKSDATLSDAAMGDYNNYEAHAGDVNLESITSSERNALILEKLRNNYDAMKWMGIVGGDDEVIYDITEDHFVVHEGDDLGWLGYFIGKSKWLETLCLLGLHLSGDKFLGQGLAQNQSIRGLYIHGDLGVAGLQTLAPLLQNTNTLEELSFSTTINECAQNIALLLNQSQVKSLKRLLLDDNNLSGEGFEAIASALRAQPQLEELDLSTISREDAPFDQRGYAALGATMKNWTSPSLNKLVINESDLDDEGLLALAEGMANCVNLEHLYLRGNDQITEVGLRAMSYLFQLKKFCLRSLDLSSTGIENDGMITLASGLATFESLKSLTLAGNAMGDEGLKALAACLSNSNNLETLDLSYNGLFSAIGLRQFSDLIPAALNLKELYLSGSSINGEGMQALAVGLRNHRALERLDLSDNAIGSEGLRALAAAEISSLRSLNLSRTAINDEAMGVFKDWMAKLCNLTSLNLSCNNLVTSSGLAVLTPIFRRGSCSLKEIDLSWMDIDESVAQSFAEALVGNESLEKLSSEFSYLTFAAWSAFSTLLCDTSSVNNTYLSNHTLEAIGCSLDAPSSVRRYLSLNRQTQYDVSICKILMSHSDLDMTPLLQWKLKLLPFVLAWFERARSCRAYLRESIMKFERRELSVLYRFIRGLPLLAASGFYKQKSTEAHSKKRKFDHCDK